jgi:hypothetical protein
MQGRGGEGELKGRGFQTGGRGGGGALPAAPDEEGNGHEREGGVMDGAGSRGTTAVCFLPISVRGGGEGTRQGGRESSMGGRGEWGGGGVEVGSVGGGGGPGGVGCRGGKRGR